MGWDINGSLEITYGKGWIKIMSQVEKIEGHYIREALKAIATKAAQDILQNEDTLLAYMKRIQCILSNTASDKEKACGMALHKIEQCYISISEKEVENEEDEE